jgi:DNA polymerase-3 subunit beta
MKVSMLQDNLTNGLRRVGKTVSKKSTLPVLESVRISTHAGRVYLETSDLDTDMRVGVGAVVDQDGSICVPYTRFAKFVDRLSPERVELDIVQRTMELNIVCGATKASFKGIDGEEFPLIPWPRDNEAEDSPSIMINAAVLLKLLNEVLYAASKDDVLPALSGVWFEYDTNTLKVTTSDTKRMAHREYEFGSPSFDGKVSGLVPLSAIEKFKSLFADEIKYEEDIDLIFNAGMLFIVSGNAEFAVHLTEGQFPDYTHIFFANDLHTLRVDPDGLSIVLKRSEVFSEFTSLESDKDKQIIRVSATSRDLGTTDSVVDAYVIGESIKSGYKISQLVETLAKFDGYSIRADFKNVSNIGYMIKFTPEYAAWHIIMPTML